MKFTLYNLDEHFQICLNIYQSNCPQYFLEEETEDFIAWLSKTEESPYWVVEDNNQIVGCGGIYSTKPTDKIKPDVKDEVGFAWGMIHQKFHKQGYGKKLSLFRINYLERHYPNRPIVLRTTQHTYQFFQKIGFETLIFEENGFGGGLDKYIMVKSCLV